MLRVVFVILHYNNLKDTVNCIKSLEKYCENWDVELVIVDNGSVDEPVSLIINDFGEKEYIHFVISEENLGFAKGNNLGFQFAKNNLNADIVILSNNDIIYYQNDFIEVLLEDYEKEKFDIAGPKIIRVEDQLVQNPTPRIYHTQKDVLDRIVKFFVLYLLTFIGLDNVFRKLFGNSEDVEVYKVGHDEDFQLHGACLIFGKKYIDNYDGLYDRTFMYGEESILKYISDRDSLKMVYLDNIELSHLEGSTVSSIYGKGAVKRRFFYKWNLKGCLELYKLMKRGKNIE